MIRSVFLLLFVLLGACAGLPEGVEPVTGFQAERYQGRWYEIARLDHSFERGMSRVTAEYTARADGGLDVLNRGYLAESGTWKQARGTAYFVDGPDRGHLKVSFFGPFYGSYVIFELDAVNYSHALVSGPGKTYLWLLARSPALDVATRDRLVARAATLGFDTDGLIFVDHDQVP
jgi:apolipoprotein D and lipocalin family protein